tara:strand:- start:1472 stop:1939 length:468 start_codon:yes stop_codon:yes gene_type:complete
MYLVVHSTKTEEVTFTGYGCLEKDKLEDHWSAHETYEDALEEYRKILLLNDLYSVSIAGVLRSTDYDNFSIGDVPVVEPKLRTFQIVGRIPDRENRSQTVKAENLKSALRKFEKELYEWEGEDQEEVSEVHGVSVYFDAIFEGDIAYDPNNPKEV